MFFLVSADFFFKNIFFQKNLSGTQSVCQTGLDPDQDRHCIGPDLGLNCLCNRYQQTTKVAAVKKRVKIPMV